MQLFHEKLHFRGLLGIFRGIKKEKTREKKDGMKTKNGLKQTSIHFLIAVPRKGQNETLISPVISVGGGTSFSPMVVSHS